MGSEDSSKDGDGSPLEIVKDYISTTKNKYLDTLIDHVHEIYYLEQCNGSIVEMANWRKRPPTSQLIQYILTNCDEELHEWLLTKLPPLPEPSTPSLLSSAAKSDTSLATGHGGMSQTPFPSSGPSITDGSNATGTHTSTSLLPSATDSPTSSSTVSSVTSSTDPFVKISPSAAMAATSAVHTYSSLSSKSHSSRTNASSNGNSNSTGLLTTLPSNSTNNVPLTNDGNLVSSNSSQFGSLMNKPSSDQQHSTSEVNSGLLPQGESMPKPGVLIPRLQVGNNLVSNSNASPSLKSLTNLAPPSQGTTRTPTTSNSRQGSYGSRSYATRQKSISASFDAAIGNSQEQIVQKAQQEAHVMQRIAELRKQGLWSTKKLPKVQEPPREKAHWDFLLEEMSWLATDFAQERKWKKTAAKKCALMIAKYHRDKEAAKEREKREELQRLKKIASTLAKEVRSFWSNVEKLVEYKQQTALEKKRKQVMDMHLNFIVGQTEQYTEWLTEGFKPIANVNTSAAPSRSTSATEIGELDDDVSMDSVPEPQDDLSTAAITSAVNETTDDGDFNPEHLDSDEGEDDEETIAKADEEAHKTGDQREEVDKLNAEMDIPLEELLPKEILESLGGVIPSASSLANLPPRASSSTLTSEGETATEDEDDDEEDEDEDDDDDDNDDEDEEEADVNEEDTNMDVTEGDQGKEITDIAASIECIQPKGNTLSTATVNTTVPFLLRGSLREYQHIGLDWLVAMYEKKLNGILADEMGLGKTIQTIALLAHLACEKGIWGPHLIVVPTSVMLNWEMEFKKWCPAFKTLTYYGSQKERRLKRQGWTKTNQFHICITSYKLVIQDHNSFRRKKWHYLILDEAQHIKNFKSQRWQMLLNFNTCRRLLLTGTPLQNNLMELWSLMHFLMPNVFSSHRDFKDWFVNPVTGMIEGNDTYNEDLVRRLHKILRPFLLRRLKKDVEKQLPQKIEHVILCKLSKRQRYLYEEFMSRTKTKDSLASGNFLSVINVLMQLRKVCNHPNLFETRPITTPFACRPLTFTTASLVTKVLSDSDWTKNVSLESLSLSNCIDRCSLPSYVHHRIQKFKTMSSAIEAIDTLPSPEPRIPRGKMKFQIKTKSNNNNASQPLGVNSNLHIVSNSSEPEPKRRRLDSMAIFTKATVSSSLAAPSPILHSQNQISLQQIDFAPSRIIPSSTVNIVSTPSCSITGNLQLKRITLKNGAEVNGSEKASSIPLGELRVSDIGQSFNSFLNTNGLPSGTVTETVHFNPTDPSKLFDLPVIKQRQVQQRQEQLSFLGYLNNLRCFDHPPLYPDDLLEIFTINKRLDEITTKPTFFNITTNEPRSIFNVGAGHYHCKLKSSFITDASSFLDYTGALCNLIKTPFELLDDLDPILKRFVIVVPPVVSSKISFHVSHPEPSQKTRDEAFAALANINFSPAFACLHEVLTSMKAQFPELRLIQYDCGKLQALDTLLRQLKSEGHRVLLFTQMSRMLDIFEQFLNYHGHTYLRLDGATKIEQRQALMERFNADKRIFAFILSTRSGGVGVNLTGADTVIFYDSDWNPTMDAQAQDRCHRIGQTKDVHIYRLISERTVEENVLKKAQQKKLLSDLAIEEGSFTTAFFKQNAVQELFGDNLCGQGRSLRDEMAASQEKSVDQFPKTSASTSTDAFINATVVSQDSSPTLEDLANIPRLQEFEKALEKVEEKEDIVAAKTSKAEAKAEFAEFDENVPFDDADAGKDDEADELERLVEELTPIEKYALTFLELNQDPAQLEELKQAEEEIEAHKKDWELEHLKSLKAEAERVESEPLAATGSLEEPLTIPRDTALNQVATLTPLASGSLNGLIYNETTGFATTTYESMFTWTPPTPPQEQEDFYVDHTLAFSYERHVMSEAELPPFYSPRDSKRLKLDPSVQGTRAAVPSRPKPKPRKDDITYPRSLFDRPSPALLRLRREIKTLKVRGQIQGGPDAAAMAKLIAAIGPNTTIPTPPTLMSVAQMSKNSAAILASIQPENHIPWSIVDEYHMLHVIQQIQELPSNLIVISPGHTPNWDLVSDYVSNSTFNFRGMRICRHHFESVVNPREEGKVVTPPVDSGANPAPPGSLSGSTKKKKKSQSAQGIAPAPGSSNIPPSRTPLAGNVHNIPPSQVVGTKLLYSKDGCNTFSNLTKSRIDSIRSILHKREDRQKNVSCNSGVPIGKNNPKHIQILSEYGVTYDNPDKPHNIATARLAKEKLRSQQYQQDQLAARQRQMTQLAQRQHQHHQQAVAVATQLQSQVQQQSSQVPHRQIPAHPVHVAANASAQVIATPVPSTGVPQAVSAVLAAPAGHLPGQNATSVPASPVIQVPPNPVPPVQPPGVPVVLTVTGTPNTYGQLSQAPAIARPVVTQATTVTSQHTSAPTSYVRLRVPAGTNPAVAAANYSQLASGQVLARTVSQSSDASSHPSPVVSTSTTITPSLEKAETVEQLAQALSEAAADFTRQQQQKQQLAAQQQAALQAKQQHIIPVSAETAGQLVTALQQGSQAAVTRQAKSHLVPVTADIAARQLQQLRQQQQPTQLPTQVASVQQLLQRQQSGQGAAALTGATSTALPSVITVSGTSIAPVAVNVLATRTMAPTQQPQVHPTTSQGQVTTVLHVPQTHGQVGPVQNLRTYTNTKSTSAQIHTRPVVSGSVGTTGVTAAPTSTYLRVRTLNAGPVGIARSATGITSTAGVVTTGTAAASTAQTVSLATPGIQVAANRIINLRGSGATQIIARQATDAEIQLIRQPGPQPGIFLLSSAGPGANKTQLARIIAGNIVSQSNVGTSAGTTSGGESNAPTVVTLRSQPHTTVTQASTLLTQQQQQQQQQQPQQQQPSQPQQPTQTQPPSQ